ncbi:MAG: hypothetical protein U0167_12480 [bacterium]
MARQRLFADTTPEAEEVLLAIYREMPPWRKLELVDDAIRTSRQLAWAGLRHRYPDESVERLRRRLCGLVLGEELATKVYGPLDEAR